MYVFIRISYVQSTFVNEKQNRKINIIENAFLLSWVGHDKWSYIGKFMQCSLIAIFAILYNNKNTFLIEIGAVFL